MRFLAVPVAFALAVTGCASSPPSALASSSPVPSDTAVELTFLEAIDANDVAVVRSFLEMGIDPEAEIRPGITPLPRAIHQEAIDVVELLVERVDINEWDPNGDLPLIITAAASSGASTVILLDAGADPNLVAARNSITALIEASKSNNTEVVNLLLAAGADTEATDQFGRTALMYAGIYDNRDVIIALLVGGADANASFGSGSTAADWAEFEGNFEAAELLRRAED